MASKRRLREARVKDNKGNSGRDFRAARAPFTERELAMLADPERMESIRIGVEQSKAGLATPLDPAELLASLQRGIDDAANGRLVYRGSFAQYADDVVD